MNMFCLKIKANIPSMTLLYILSFLMTVVSSKNTMAFLPNCPAANPFTAPALSFSTSLSLQESFSELPALMEPPSSFSSTLLSASASLEDQFVPTFPLATPLIAICALILLVGSQSFINSMLSGDQGLAAFLKDGTGFQKSAFKERKPNPFGKNENAPLGSSKDPLPWLKLPTLDFVEVKGQESQQISFEEEDYYYEEEQKLQGKINKQDDLNSKK